MWNLRGFICLSAGLWSAALLILYKLCFPKSKE